MAKRNLELWKTLDEELGYPTEYSRGTAIAAMDEHDLEIFKANSRLDNERGIPSEILDVRQAREMAPLLSEDIAGMWFVHDGGHANPQRTVQAYAWALQDLGGRVHQNTTVTGIRVEGDRAVAVETDRGRGWRGLRSLRRGPSDEPNLRDGRRVGAHGAGASRDHRHGADAADADGQGERERAVRPADQARQLGLRRRQPGVDRRRS